MAHREFDDGSGVSWQVWDVLPGAQVSERFPGLTRVDTEYAAGWLAFQSQGERRRLAPIPERWVDCPDPLLREMLGAASPVKERKRFGD